MPTKKSKAGAAAPAEAPAAETETGPNDLVTVTLSCVYSCGGFSVSAGAPVEVAADEAARLQSLGVVVA